MYTTPFKEQLVELQKTELGGVATFRWCKNVDTTRLLTQAQSTSTFLVLGQTVLSLAPLLLQEL